jgi:hypothetical protein
MLRRALVLLAGAALVASLAGSARAGAPVMVSAPSITGKPMEGELLTALPGTYAVAVAPFTFEYEWMRCNPGGGSCFKIGVTGPTYTATAADIGSRLRTLVWVTGQDCTDRTSWGAHVCLPKTVQVLSELTPVIDSNPLLRPQSTAPPTITGEAEERATLTAADGGWSGVMPITTARQWERCDSGGNACVAIPDATAPTYTVTREDVARTLRVVVTGSNPRGVSGPVASAVTPVVRAFLPRPGRTTIGAGLVELPDRLVIDRIQFTPAAVRTLGRVTMRVRVSDTRGFRIRGALVHAAGVPAAYVAVGRDARTDAEGWARLTLRLRPTARVLFRPRGALRLLVTAFRSDEGMDGDAAARKTARLRFR